MRILSIIISILGLSITILSINSKPFITSSKGHITLLVRLTALMIFPPVIDAIPLPPAVLRTPIAVNNDGSTLLVPSTGNFATPFTIVSVSTAAIQNPLVQSNAANDTKTKSSIGGKPILESDVSPSDSNGSLSRNVIVSMVAFLIMFFALLLTFFFWGKCCPAPRQQGTVEQTIQDSFELSSSAERSTESLGSSDVITPPPATHIRTSK